MKWINKFSFLANRCDCLKRYKMLFIITANQFSLNRLLPPTALLIPVELVNLAVQLINYRCRCYHRCQRPSHRSSLYFALETGK